ncbi:sialate O-acetylesterase [Vibrio sp. A1-1]|uniref:sialate O-acetylesterase n=1 Tax=Vibrio sp. A1-1 TaxID=2912250 RepID=UPI001F2082E9|nr:sialate O-acetylesterase [Vibrio sp. A1-1]MCF7451877.1 sialate O-acetylesterase [Vibrio sp. A1-1]
MSNFPDLLIAFDEAVEALKVKLSQDASSTTTYNGELIQSIAKDIADRWADINAMVQGRLTYETKAAMDTAGAPPAGELAEVWNDSTLTNNGLYGWTGTAWEKSKYDNIEGIRNDLDPYRQAALPNIIKEPGNTTKERWTPVSATLDVVNYAGTKCFRQTGSGTVDYDVPLDSLDDFVFQVYLHHKPATTTGRWQCFVLQYSDEGGSGHTSGTELSESRTIFSPGYSEVNDVLYNQIITPNPLAKRLVIRCNHNGEDHTTYYGRFLLTHDLEGQYRNPQVDLDSMLADLEQNKTDISNVQTDIDQLSNQTTSIRADLDQVSESVIPVERNAVVADINHIIVSGQSLGVGVGSSPHLTLSQIYDNLMPNTGQHDGNADSQGITSSPTSTSFVDLISSGPGETVAAGGANVVTALGATGQQLASNNARGGYSIAGLVKGTDYYNWGIEQVSLYQGLSNAIGKTFVHQAIWWLQGESDSSNTVTQAYYKNALTTLIDDWNLDISQSHRVPLLTYQMASHCVRNVTADPGVPLAQLAASNEHSDIYLVSPTYHLTYNADDVHLPSHSTRWLGHYFAKVHYRVCVLGVDWKPLSPKAVRQQGALIDIEFHVPVPPLVFDNVAVSDPGDYGFAVEKVSDGSEVGIASVSLRGSTGVRLVLTSDPGEAVTVNYALGKVGDKTGPIDGARGCLRDSDGMVSLYNDANGDPYKLYNWCVMFSENAVSY